MTADDPADAIAERLSRAPWRSLGEADLAPAAGVPTMLSDWERRLYLWLAWHYAEGAGAIVDLGCFAGGSTAHLAEGVRRAGRQTEVHGYDGFKISPKLKERYLYPAGVPPFEGDDLLPAAERFLAPWQDIVRLHPGRIEHGRWPGGPIEILVLDASKTAATMDRMAEMFFPSLIPGRSLVVQQDHLHWKQPWVAAQMALMRDAFRPVAHCPRDSVVFLCTAEITGAVLAGGRCAGLDDGQMIAALEQAKSDLAGLGLSDRAARLGGAVAANPGARAAWKLTKAPG